MKIYQIVSEQSNPVVKQILRDLKKLSPQEQKVFQELVTTRKEDFTVGETKSVNGTTYRWEGAQWVDTNTGKIADRQTQLNLSTEGEVTDQVAALYKQAKDQKSVNDVAQTFKSKSKSTRKKSPKKKSRTGEFVSDLQKATGREGPSKKPGEGPSR